MCNPQWQTADVVVGAAVETAWPLVQHVHPHKGATARLLHLWHVTWLEYGCTLPWGIGGEPWHTGARASCKACPSHLGRHGPQGYFWLVRGYRGYAWRVHF